MNNQADKARFQLLVIEDNPADVQLLRLALDVAEVNCELTVIEDGAEALALFKRQGKYACAPKPDLVVLDLNLPKYGGLEILEAARETAEFADLPIAVLSSSSSPRERAKLEALGMARYLTKPADLEQYLGVGRIIRELLAGERQQSESGVKSSRRTALSLAQSIIIQDGE